MGDCDLATGECTPTDSSPERVSLPRSTTRQPTVLYFTDPICSSCWGMEPAWRRLLFLYGADIDPRYVYGGLLPSWDVFRERGGSITKPADLAPLWEQASGRNGQPVSPRVWLTDPV